MCSSICVCCIHDCAKTENFDKPDLKSFSNTVEPLLSGHLLSGRPLLSGQLLKSRNYFQLNTINKTPIKRKRPPFGRPDEGFLLFFTPIKQPPKIKYAWFGFVFDKAMTDKNPK